MRTMLASIRGVCSLDTVERILIRYEQSFGGGGVDLRAFWLQNDPDQSLEVLSALVKIELRRRSESGEPVTAAEYLARFPELSANKDRVISLVYEEYCLNEERGHAPNPESFCQRYAPWSDSLASQLQYHHMFGKAAGAVPATPRRFPEAGERFNWYRLRSVLGQGGAARVFLALDEELGDREVALKISADQGKEPSILGRLDHAHIIPVLSVSRDLETGLRGLCMPYRPGLPLNEVISRFALGPRPHSAKALWDIVQSPPRPGEEPATGSPTVPKTGGWQTFPFDSSYSDGVAWIVSTLAKALGHAHSLGILHRDVKPANVLLTSRDGPQLLDFNLAHDPHAADRAEAALRGGTLPYMAPEQLEAFIDPNLWSEVGAPADIYSLGLLMRELLTGESPDTAGTSTPLPLPRAIREHLDRRRIPFDSLRKFDRTMPHALDAITGKCLCPTTNGRYQTTTQLAEDLDAFLGRCPLFYAANKSIVETSTNWSKRNRRPLLVAVAALGLIAAGFTYSKLTHWSPFSTNSIRDGKNDIFENVYSALEKRDLAAAERLLKSKRTQDPKSPIGTALQGVIKLRQGEGAAATALFLEISGSEREVVALELAAKLEPKSAQLQELLGWARVRSDLQLESAAEALELAAVLDPKTYGGFRSLGLEKSGDDTQGWEDLLRAIAWSKTGKNRGRADYHFIRASAHLGSESTYRKAIEIEPKLAPLWTGLGIILKKKGNMAAARAAFESALRLEPDHPGTCHELFRLEMTLEQPGQIELTAEHLREALNYMERAIRSAERRGYSQDLTVPYYGDRAIVLQKLGEKSHGRKAAQQLANPSALQALEDGEAREFFTRAVEDITTTLKAKQPSFNSEFRFARAKVGIGDTYSFENRYEESLANYQAADARLRHAIELAGPNAVDLPDCKNLRYGLDIRLSNDGGIVQFKLAKETTDPIQKRSHLETAKRLFAKAEKLGSKDSDLPKLIRDVDTALQDANTQ